MNPRRRHAVHVILLSLACLTLTSGLAPAADEAAIRHRFLAMDFWRGQLYYVDQTDPARNWQMPWVGGVRDVQLVGNRRLLISAADGFDVYDLGQRVKTGGVHRPELRGTVTARRLPDGSTWLGANLKQAVTLWQLDAADRLVRTVTVPGIHYLRMIRFTSRGTLLLCEFDGATEATLDAGVPDDKRILRRFKLPHDRNAYMALAAADGTYWVAGGYAHGLFQYRADGTLLRTFEAPQPAGLVNHFYAGFQFLPNGHVVQANWTGHNAKDFKDGWKLIEFDRQGQVVWHWHVPPEQAGTINNVIVLDDLDPAVFNDDASGILGPQK